MKNRIRLLAGLLSLLLLFTGMPTAALAGETFVPTKKAKDGTIVGDVNKDNAVDATDRMLLARYLAGWEGYEERILSVDAADIDRDGEVNAKDRMLLARFLAGWEGYEEYFTGEEEPNYSDGFLRTVSCGFQNGFGPEDDDHTVTAKEFFAMMDRAVEIGAPDHLAEWKTMLPEARNYDGTLIRAEGMVIMYYAARIIDGKYRGSFGYRLDWLEPGFVPYSAQINTDLFPGVYEEDYKPVLNSGEWADVN